MIESYRLFDNLRQHRARLLDHTQLEAGIGLASWSNRHDRIHQTDANHHTLSLYIADGYESYRKTAGGWRNGGGPDRLCLMPQAFESVWDIRGPLSFVHLYFTDEHLRRLAEQTWDRSPAELRLDARIFAEDPQITLLFRQFLLTCNWQDSSDRLALGSAVTLLLNHLLKHYSTLRWPEVQVRGGLAPYQLNRLREYIDAHLDQPLRLADLAAEAGLSEYHFARMFKQSQGQAPHQYLLQQRLQRAERLLRESSESITEIALRCGFSSTSHFSNRFRQARGIAPSALRRTLNTG